MPRHDRSVNFGIGAITLGGVIGGVAAAHKISEALVHLHKLLHVGDDNMVFARIVERVRFDLVEVERLLALEPVKFALSKNPEKVAWIRKSISAVKMALHEMVQFTLRVRKDTDRGKLVGLRNRVFWRLEEEEKLVMHSREVARCHDGLLNVLAFLSSLEPLACCEEDKNRRYSSQQYVKYDGDGRDTYQGYQHPRDGRVEVDYTRRVETQRPAHIEGRFDGDSFQVDHRAQAEPYPRYHDDRFIDVDIAQSAQVQRHGPEERAHSEARYFERDGHGSIQIDRRNSSLGGREEKHYSIRQYGERDHRDLRDRDLDRFQDKIDRGLSKL